MFKLTLILALLFTTNSYAYLGPGLAIGAVYVVLAIVGAIFVAIIGAIYIPIKRFFKKKKKRK